MEKSRDALQQGVLLNPSPLLGEGDRKWEKNIPSPIYSSVRNFIYCHSPNLLIDKD
jgi:hypothetical protein